MSTHWCTTSCVPALYSWQAHLTVDDIFYNLSVRLVLMRPIFIAIKGGFLFKWCSSSAEIILHVHVKLCFFWLRLGEFYKLLDIFVFGRPISQMRIGANNVFIFVQKCLTQEKLRLLLALSHKWCDALCRLARHQRWCGARRSQGCVDRFSALFGPFTRNLSLVIL